MADLTFFLSNTARFGEMTLGFLSRLAYNSGFYVNLPKEKSCLPSNRMNIGEVKTIAKSLPLRGACGKGVMAGKA